MVLGVVSDGKLVQERGTAHHSRWIGRSDMLQDYTVGSETPMPLSGCIAIHYWYSEVDGVTVYITEKIRSCQVMKYAAMRDLAGPQ